MPKVTGDTSRGDAVLAIFLAACAGSGDVFAFGGLGKAFASIVTGNVVVFGYGLATGNAALAEPTASAVAGFILGAAIWAWLLRRRRMALALLVGELVILLAVLVGWIAASAHPHRILTLVLLALVSAAFGGQSVWALRIRQTTTYFTGMVTDAVNAAVSGSTDRLRTALRQFAALLAGAVLSGLVLWHLRPAAPALPVLLLAIAIVLHLRLPLARGEQ
jgi:uncharacterized membrane protein YoaK (UPF0700 family)